MIFAMFCGSMYGTFSTNIYAQEETADFPESNMESESESESVEEESESSEVTDYSIDIRSGSGSTESESETESETGTESESETESTSETETESTTEMAPSPMALLQNVSDLTEIWCSSSSIASKVLEAANKQNSYSKVNEVGYEAIGKVEYKYVIQCCAYDNESDDGAKVLDRISSEKSYQVTSDAKGTAELDADLIVQMIQDASKEIILKDASDPNVEWYILRLTQESSYVQNQWQGGSDVMVSMAAQEACAFMLEIEDGVRIGTMQTMYYRPDEQEFYTSNFAGGEHKVTYSSANQDLLITKAISTVPAEYHMSNVFAKSDTEVIASETLMDSNNVVFTDTSHSQNIYVSGNPEQTVNHCFAEITTATLENRGRKKSAETNEETTESTKQTDNTKTTEKPGTGGGSGNGSGTGIGGGGSTPSTDDNGLTEKPTEKTTEKTTNSSKQTDAGQNLINSLVDAQNKLNDQKSALAGLSDEAIKKEQALLSDSLAADANQSSDSAKRVKNLYNLVGSGAEKELLLDDFQLNVGKIHILPFILGAFVLTALLLYVVIKQLMKRGNSYFIR